MSIRITGHVIEYDGYRVGIISPNVPTTVLDEFTQLVETADLETIDIVQCDSALDDIEISLNKLEKLTPDDDKKHHKITHYIKDRIYSIREMLGTEE